MILGDPAADKKPELLRAFGRVVESLGGACVCMCGPEVGTSSADMDVIAEETGHVGATSRTLGSSAPPTAAGVFNAVRALAQHLFASQDLAGVRVPTTWPSSKPTCEHCGTWGAQDSRAPSFRAAHPE